MSATQSFDLVNAQRTVGNTALSVSAVSLGAAGLAGLYKEVAFDDAQVAVHSAWELGVRYFDTAPYYGYGKSERRLGQALQSLPRDEFVVSTKVGRLLKSRSRAGATPRDPNDGWASPLPFEPVFDYTYDGVMRSFEDSQQRLGLDRIDILLIHDIGRLTHRDKYAHYWGQLTSGGFKALDNLRSAGVVRAIGVGANENEAILDVMGEFTLDCCLLAGRYTLLEQTSLDELLPECTRRNVSVLLGGAFNSGILAQGNVTDAKYNYGNAPAEIIERVAQLQQVCQEFNVPLAAAAMQFPYAHPQIASVITGARSAQEITMNAAYFAQEIPAAFWETLRNKGLLDARAPLPAKA